MMDLSMFQTCLSQASSDLLAKFEYKTLDRIHGVPTLPTLLRLYRQLKRNAQCIRTTLGGGRYGYLALVLPNRDYNNLPHTTPFRRPTDPGLFRPVQPRAVSAPRLRGGRGGAAPTAPLSAAEIATQKAAHEERTCLYIECHDVETLLHKQLCKAIDDEYLNTFRNTITGTITDPHSYHHE